MHMKKSLRTNPATACAFPSGTGQALPRRGKKKKSTFCLYFNHKYPLQAKMRWRWAEREHRAIHATGIQQSSVYILQESGGICMHKKSLGWPRGKQRKHIARSSFLIFNMPMTLQLETPIWPRARGSGTLRCAQGWPGAQQTQLQNPECVCLLGLGYLWNTHTISASFRS